jgi:small conductance mechanosensitive channel
MLPLPSMMLVSLRQAFAQVLFERPGAASHRLFDNLQQIDWPELGVEWGVRLAAALLLLLVGMWLAKWLGRLLSRLLARFGVDAILTGFLGNIARAIGLVVVFIATLDYIGIPTASLLTVVGAAALGIGLAMKDSLSNIASGVMLIVLRPFRAGDEVQVAGLNGIVEQVRIFQTVLRTFDNRVIILPNSLITTAPITNFTARDRRRVDLSFGIGYGDDIRIAREILIAAASGNPRVLVDPAPDVLVAALAESSVNLVLRAWVATRDYAATKSELTETARMGLVGHGIGMPFAQRDPHAFRPGTPDARDREYFPDDAAARNATNAAPQTIEGTLPASRDGEPRTPES